MSALGTWFRTAIHQEPVVVFSCVIGAVGLALPLVVPPIREYFNTPARKNPPPVKDLLKEKTTQ